MPSTKNLKELTHAKFQKLTVADQERIRNIKSELDTTTFETPQQMKSWLTKHGMPEMMAMTMDDEDIQETFQQIQTEITVKHFILNLPSQEES